jgi:hypothetical protein
MQHAQHSRTANMPTRVVYIESKTTSASQMCYLLQTLHTVLKPPWSSVNYTTGQNPRINQVLLPSPKSDWHALHEFEEQDEELC